MTNQMVELRTSSRRIICGRGVIVGETKTLIKVKVESIDSPITRVVAGQIINFSKLDGKSKLGFAIGLKEAAQCIN